MFQRCSFYGGATGGYALYLASYGSPLSAIVQNSVFYGDWAYDAISNHGTNTVFTDNIFNGATAAHNGSIAVGSEAVNTIIVNNVGQNKITDAGASTFQWYVTNQLLTVVGKSTNTVSLGAPDVYAGNGFHGNADTATSLASVNATNVISAANLTLGNFTSTVCGYLKFTNNGVTYSLVLSTNNP